MTTNLFEKYLNNKKAKNQSIKVYLRATQSVPDKYNPREMRVNNIMLSGKVKDVDSSCLLLENQECLIPFESILDIKPEN